CSWPGRRGRAGLWLPGGSIAGGPGLRGLVRAARRRRPAGPPPSCRGVGGVSAYGAHPGASVPSLRCFPPTPLGRASAGASRARAETAELCQGSDRPAGEVAPEVGLVEAAVRAGAGRDAGVGDDGGLTSAERRELAALRRENRRLREGAEMLQRVAAMLATGE